MKVILMNFKSNCKKVTAMIFVVIICISSITCLEVTAVSITSNTAVNWANSQIGKGLNYDGVHGTQCVDLIKYYYAYLGVAPVQGSGCDYATNSLPGGWSRIKYYSGFIPQPGDIAVWTYSTSSSGHVAIITSADSSRMNVVEQNSYAKVRAWQYSYSYGTFYGVIRPNFQAGQVEAPDAPIVWLDKNIASPNEQIRINFWSERASRYWVGIYKDGNLIHDSYTYNGYYDVSFADTGNYNVTVSADNAYGYNASYISFTIKTVDELVPDPPQVWANKTNLLPNEHIRLNFWSDRAEKYWIGIYKDGKLIHDEYAYVGYYDLSFDTTGVYNIAVSADNSYGYKASYISFNVVDVIFGDVNDDNAINGKDGIILSQYLAEWGTEINLDAADVNGDGVVNGKDSIILSQYLAAWDVELGK